MRLRYMFLLTLDKSKVFLLTNLTKTSVQNTNFIIGLSLLIIGIICFCLVLLWILWIKKHQANKEFNTSNRSDTIWYFTKKNFPFFLLMFFLILGITGLTLLI